MNRIFLLAFIAIILMSNMAYAEGERFSVDISALRGSSYNVHGLYSGVKPVGHYFDPNIEFGPSIGFSVGTDIYLNDHTALRADISLLDAHAREDYIYTGGFASIESSRSRKIPIFIGGRFRAASSDIEIYVEGGPEYTYEENKVEYREDVDISDSYGSVIPVDVSGEDEEKNEYIGGVLGVGMKFYIDKRMYIGLGIRQHYLEPYNYYNGAVSIGFRINK
jgi:outer membrane protein W